jgi:hypothetical protein
LCGLLFCDLVGGRAVSHAPPKRHLTVHHHLLVFAIRYLLFPSIGQVWAISS